MTPTQTVALLATLSIGLAGCTDAGLFGQSRSRPQATAAPAAASTAAASTAATRAPVPAPAARASAEALNTTTAEQRAAAAAPPKAAAETRLGTTVASLGDPTQPGFWIKTPLVSEIGMGRIVNPATGKSAKVELQPLSGGGTGSQVSLPALQLLGVSLTDLPTLEVYKS